jgi:hypothetical protein
MRIHIHIDYIKNQYSLLRKFQIFYLFIALILFHFKTNAIIFIILITGKKIHLTNGRILLRL